MHGDLILAVADATRNRFSIDSCTVKNEYEDAKLRAKGP